MIPTLEQLPTVNAALNAAATFFLVAGYVLIRRRHERAHIAAMLAAVAVSAVFLVSYLTYHFGRQYYYGSAHVPFSGPPLARTIYLTILVTHVVLAVSVPVLAVAMIYLGWRDRRAAHRRLGRWAWPIWLYVSVTGVVVYVMLYRLYPAPAADPIIGARDGRPALVCAAGQFADDCWGSSPDWWRVSRLRSEL